MNPICNTALGLESIHSFFLLFPIYITYSFPFFLRTNNTPTIIIRDNPIANTGIRKFIESPVFGDASASGTSLSGIVVVAFLSGSAFPRGVSLSSIDVRGASVASGSAVDGSTDGTGVSSGSEDAVDGAIGFGVSAASGVSVTSSGVSVTSGNGVGTTAGKNGG